MPKILLSFSVPLAVVRLRRVALKILSVHRGSWWRSVRQEEVIRATIQTEHDRACFLTEMNLDISGSEI
jgi:hypothetical protein